MESNTTEPLHVGAAIFIGCTALVSLAAIVSNVLLLSIIFAAEKIGSNVANLVFLCIPHLELAILVLAHRAITYNSKKTEDICFDDLLVECLERGSVLWSISGITSLTIFQYLHIVKPFWYEAHISSKTLIISSLVAGSVSHIIGIMPFMRKIDPGMGCQQSPLETAAYVIFAAIVIIQLGIIIGLCVKMFALAEKHRQRMKEYQSMKTSRGDSLRFLIILIVTYIVSHIVPVVAELVQLGMQTRLEFVTRMDVLHLLAALIYAILYGSRTPQGFGRSIRMAICCCLPVEPTGKPIEIDDVVRLTMMRLGNVMMKIDENAASKRHSSFLKKKSQIFKNFSFLRPSDNEHKQVRPYNSLDPALCRASPPDEVKDKASRTVSLNITNIENGYRHERAGRIFSWLPKKTGARKFDVMQRSSEEGISGAKNTPSTMVTLTAMNMPRKLSNISENSVSVDILDNENNSKTATERTSLKNVMETTSTEHIDVVLEKDHSDSVRGSVITDPSPENVRDTLHVVIEENDNSLNFDGASTHSMSPCLKHMPLERTDRV